MPGTWVYMGNVGFLPVVSETTGVECSLNPRKAVAEEATAVVVWRYRQNRRQR